MQHDKLWLIGAFLLAIGIGPNPALLADDEVHDPSAATSQFDVHPELEVGLFAAEPLLANPTNIDVDHLGRVWVCEVVNYRHRIANGDMKEREAGDRILILEDTDGDAKADKETVFYQGRDIDSAHGICVLGDRAIVSAGDSVFFLIDSDSDLKADKKEILFTGIGGVQHDHGIHAFVFGPDGKLYFNFGNEGRQIRDARGQPIIDRAGNEVNNQRQPYQQGMVFRCELDGSNFETLAWNFRNNWEIAVDSFGSLWQSDNDDDGNRGVRINYVMPFGNYGYVQELTGSGWRQPRTGMHDDIPTRHWHQNDPGVVPNLLQTGAGSPTGICIYEGDSLPSVFRNQMIHCDAGPNIVRSYPVQKSGAGYSAEIVDLIDGASKNQWFRPADVCVAPDGSLIVADWYDPGVGGHRMRDIERGRLFHITSKGKGGHYGDQAPDYSSPDSAVEALQSPNLATRYLAWKALQTFGDRSLDSLSRLWKDSNPRFRARALWVIGKLNIAKATKLKFIREALTDPNPDLRITGIRLARQLQTEIKFADIKDVVRLDDSAPEFRREILISLREWPTEQLPAVWSELADQYPAGDRWYLEALGIAADGHWDECLDEWLLRSEATTTSKLAWPKTLDILWRSRGSKSAELIADIIADSKTTVGDLPRYFRAFDFLKGESTTRVLTQLAFGQNKFADDKSRYVLLESIKRLGPHDLTEEHNAQLNELIEKSRSTPQFVEFVNRFASEKHYDELLNIAATAQDKQLAADAMSALMDKRQMRRVHKFLVHTDDEKAEVVMDALVNSGKRPAASVLAGFGKRIDLNASPRQMLAIKRLGRIHSGAKDMIGWIDAKQDLNPAIMPAIAAALHNAPWPDIKNRANELFPIAPSKENRPLPAIAELIKKKGDAGSGQKVYAGVGTCSKCHQVNGQGTNVGPDLSEIGSKLTREAMYESILFPSAGISHNYENWMVMTEQGQMINGLLLSETDQQVQIIDANGIKHTIEAEEIEEMKKQKLSLMPADLHRELTELELVDVVEYMTTLRGKTRID